MTNRYSPLWYEFFLDTLRPEQTEHEIAFLVRQLPNPPYRALLDVCCGAGRHAQPLAGRGYRVTGIDLNPAALAKARILSNGNPLYLQHDMRRLADLPGVFDAIVCLWQSFGYFDEAANADVLRQMSKRLSPNGRLALDIYHRGFFERHTGRRLVEQNGHTITETKTLSGNRLRVELDYGLGRDADVFEWQLYTPDEICALAASFGFHTRLVCSGFDETCPASADAPRMQIVFEKATV